MVSKTNLLGMAAILVIGASVQPYRPVVVSGQSMAPTYSASSVVVASKRFDQLHRGDVVIVHHGADTLVKRILYVAGDQIPQFWADDEWEFPISNEYLRAARKAHYPMRMDRVPEGYIFVVGDNFHYSCDSREFGSLPVKNVVMKVLMPSRSFVKSAIPGAKLAREQWVASTTKV